MKTVRTRELTGAELDFAVALVIGASARLRDGVCLVDGLPFRPSTDWSVGGPIVADRRIELNPPNPSRAIRQDWFARCLTGQGPSGLAFGVGEEALVAAMRALVASEFPLSIELPTQGV